MAISHLLAQGLGIFFPKTCAMCHGVLVEGEEDLCLNCELSLPLNPGEWWEENKLAQTFYCRVPFEGSFALCRYAQGSPFDNVLYSMKYSGRTEVCRRMGRLIGSMIRPHFPEDDVQLLPVPTHRRKRRKRGYNQAEEIARGMHEETGWQVLDQALIKTRNAKSQTTLNRTERWKNVQQGFRRGKIAPDFTRPILLLDDVVTTGATIEACYQGLGAPKESRLYLVAVAFSQH